MEPKEDLLSLFRLKREINELFFREFYNIYQFQDGLNSTHILTMIHLDHLGPVPMTQISQFLQMEKGSFTPVAGKLTELGYIEKNRNAVDKRIFELSLTAKGRTLVGEFKKEHREYINRSLSRLTEAEQNEYFQLTQRLNQLNTRLREEMGLPGILD